MQSKPKNIPFSPVLIILFILCLSLLNGVGIARAKELVVDDNVNVEFDRYPNLNSGRSIFGFKINDDDCRRLDTPFEQLNCSKGVSYTYSLRSSAKQYTLGTYIEYLEDKEKKLTIDDVTHLNGGNVFQQSNEVVPRFGFSSSAYWFRLKVRNLSNDDRQLYLEVKNSYIDQIDFFRPDGMGGWIEKRTGQLFPFATRDIKRGTFIFQFVIPQKSAHVYYMRFEGDSSLDMPLFLYTEEGFQDSQYKKNMYMGFYLGATCIMMFISLFLFFQIRDTALFYYFLYLGTTILTFSYAKGLTEQYLWPLYPFWANQSFIVFYSLLGICFLLFTRAFLDTPKHLKVLDKILFYEILIISACIIPGVVAPYKIGVQLLLFLSIIYMLTALVSGIVCYFKGKKAAGYYLLACSPIIINSTIRILLTMNFMPFSRVFTAYLYSSPFLTLTLLSIAIIGRVKLLHDEKQEVLEKANSVKDEFLAKTSHELRTPLHGIIGITESLIDQKSKNKLPQSVRNQLNVIMASGKRLASLINDILDISRLKNQEILLQKKSLDFYQLTEIVLTLCRSLTIGKDLRLVNSIPKDLSPVEGDENRLQQILHNLVGNAIKFTENGTVTLTAVECDNRVAISIHDTGRGIPEEQLEAIFQNFEQVHSAENQNTLGAGLGLSIVKNLVELHGGTIKVTSEVGKGSTFSFDLPTSTSPPEISVEPTLAIASLHSGKEEELPEIFFSSRKRQEKFDILVVDDEPINLQVVNSHLKEQGFSVRVVTSGEEALTAIEKKIPHLVLLDVMMPTMSGFEVCRRIREDYSQSQIVVIFLTAKNQVTDLVEGFSLGANDYICKPFSKNELLTRVKYHLGNYQMAKRFICLTEFSCRLSKLNELKKVFKEAFHLICEQLPVDYGVLIADEKIITKYGNSADRLTLDLFLSEKGEEYEEISFQRFHSSELMRIHPLFFKEFGLLLMKEEHQMFSKMDVEFVRNILTTIKITRENLREIVSDARFMTSLTQIRESLDSVVCIKSQRNYCSIICEEGGSDSFELRISLQKIQTFFKESELLKINRSTLINPSKVQSLQRVAKQKYSVIMTNNETLSISRSLEKQVRVFLESM